MKDIKLSHPTPRARPWHESYVIYYYYYYNTILYVVRAHTADVILRIIHNVIMYTARYTQGSW